MITVVERIAYAPRTVQATNIEPEGDAAAEERRTRKRAERALADRARGKRCLAMRPLRDAVDRYGWELIAQLLDTSVARAIQLSRGAEPRGDERCAVARMLAEL